jgi:hypothetical protein
MVMEALGIGPTLDEWPVENRPIGANDNGEDANGSKHNLGR